MSQKAVHPWRRTWQVDPEIKAAKKACAAKRRQRQNKVRDKHSAILPEPQSE